jgi:hypothetical protein
MKNHTARATQREEKAVREEKKLNSRMHFQGAVLPWAAKKIIKGKIECGKNFAEGADFGSRAWIRGVWRAWKSEVVRLA